MHPMVCRLDVHECDASLLEIYFTQLDVAREGYNPTTSLLICFC